jgi:hypothetical protein
MNPLQAVSTLKAGPPRAPTLPQHADAATIGRYLRSRLPEYMVPKSLYARESAAFQQWQGGPGRALCEESA